MPISVVIVALAVFARASAATPDSAAPLRNWYNDPFFTVSEAIPGCPVPRGPLQTKAEMEREAHVRVERGTRCYQEGRCARMSSYHYDADIAADLQLALAGSPLLKGTSLWVSVQRRWVSIQGCAKNKSIKPRLEAIARRVRDVENAFVDLRVDPKEPAPYVVLPSTPDNR